MIPTIEIKLFRGACSPECSAAKFTEQGAMCFLKCTKGTGLVMAPGPDCPGPGKHRLVNEEKIEKLWITIQSFLGNLDWSLHNIERELDNAGLGRKQ
jgi:hypothetical protein